jgi:hypothetical protein
LVGEEANDYKQFGGEDSAQTRKNTHIAQRVRKIGRCLPTNDTNAFLIDLMVGGLRKRSPLTLSTQKLDAKSAAESMGAVSCLRVRQPSMATNWSILCVELCRKNRGTKPN